MKTRRRKRANKTEVLEEQVDFDWLHHTPEQCLAAIKHDEWRSKAEAYHAAEPCPQRLSVLQAMARHTEPADFNMARGWYEGPLRPLRLVSYSNNLDSFCEELVKYVHMRRNQYAGKRFVDIGCGHGASAIGFAHMGFETTAIERNPYALNALVMGIIENNVTVEIRPGITADEVIAEDFDICTMGRVFYQRQMADDNLAIARKLANAGVTMLIASISLFDNDNEFVSVPDEDKLDALSWSAPGSRPVRRVFTLRAQHGH